MTEQTSQPKKSGLLKWGCGGCLGVFVILVIIGAIGNAISPVKQSANVQNQQPIAAQVATSGTPAAAPQEQFKLIYSLKGKGNRDSESFATNGGRLKMVAQADGSSQGSFSGVTLKSESGDYLSGAELMLSTDNSKPATGETIIRNADAGKYYVSVISGVYWEVKVYEEK